MSVTQPTATDTTMQAIPDHVRVIMNVVRNNIITDEYGSYLPHTVGTRKLYGFNITVMKYTIRTPYTMVISVVDHDELTMTCHYDSLELLQDGIAYATTRNMLNSFLERSIAGMQATIARLATIAMNIE